MPKRDRSGAECANHSFGRLRIAALSALALGCATPVIAQGSGTIEIDFDPGDFSQSLTIDNTYFPLVPGTVSTFMGESEDGCEWSVTTVTNDTYGVAAGVTTRVVHDAAYEDEACDGYSDDELVENTFDWFAQDDSGNVWYLGEASEDCDGADACEPNDGSWEAGVDGAQAGIQMLADPQAGNRYYQEYYEGFAEDEAKVDQTDIWLSLYNSDVFDHSLQHCIRTKEWSKLEPGANEHKFYCPDVGLVLIKELKGKTLRVELVDLFPEP